MTTNQDPFRFDAEGFRALNKGRPPAELARELIQNSFDEQPSTVKALVTREDKGAGVILVIEDDAGGIRDPATLWTVYKSDKKDDPTKRGRMGRGLKEAIVVSDNAVITSTLGTVAFERSMRGGKPHWRRQMRNEKSVKGTHLTFRFKNWGPREADAIVSYLRTILPPPGVTFLVNAEERVVPVPWRVLALDLPTVVFDMEEGAEKKVRQTAQVHVHEGLVGPDGEPWLFEMGIPVQPIDCPWSVDVQQRVPMNPNRNAVSVQYLRSLYAQLLNMVGEEVHKDLLRDQWVNEAVQSRVELRPEVKDVIVKAWTKGALLATTSAEAKAAEGHHLDVVLASEIPKAVRPLVREHAPRALDHMDKIESENTKVIPPNKQTPEETRLIRCWLWLVQAIGRGRYVESIVVSAGTVEGRVADYSPLFKRITLYRNWLSGSFFNDPLSAEALEVFIHEVAHGRIGEHSHGHGEDFADDCVRVGGATAEVLWTRRPELKAVLAGVEA